MTYDPTRHYFNERQAFEHAVGDIAREFERGSLTKTEAQAGQLHFRVGPYKVRTDVAEVTHVGVEAPPPRSTGLTEQREQSILSSTLGEIARAMGKAPKKMDLQGLDHHSAQGMRLLLRDVLTEMQQLREAVETYERAAQRDSFALGQLREQLDRLSRRSV